MKESKDVNKYRGFFVFIADIIILTLLTTLWAVMWYTQIADNIRFPFYFWGNILVIALYAVINYMVTHMYGGYKVGHNQSMDIFFSGALALIITNFLSYLQISLMNIGLIKIKPFVITTVIGIFIIAIWSYISEKLYYKRYPPYRMLMVYDGKAYAQSLIQKIMMRDDKYRVEQVVDINDEYENLCEEILKYKTVIFSDLGSKKRNDLLKFCYENKIRVYMTPKISDIMIRSAKLIELFDSPILMSYSNEMSLEQRIFKRGVDILFPIIAGILFLPFAAVIAAAIKLEDRGPVLYTQDRLTLNGKIFKIYKFRTMIVDADKIDGHRLASKGDSRITKVGKFLRKTRMDEMPQLINILKGEMSLVGPRPEHPEIASEYEKNIPEFKFRLNMKAGLTGYAQVVGKYNTTPYDKLKMDLMYITSYSMLQDIKIIFMTVKIIFYKESAEGIKDGKKDASLD